MPYEYDNTVNNYKTKARLFCLEKTPVSSYNDDIPDTNIP